MKTFNQRFIIFFSSIQWFKLFVNEMQFWCATDVDAVGLVSHITYVHEFSIRRRTREMFRDSVWSCLEKWVMEYHAIEVYIMQYCSHSLSQCCHIKCLYTLLINTLNHSPFCRIIALIVVLRCIPNAWKKYKSNS